MAECTGCEPNCVYACTNGDRFDEKNLTNTMIDEGKQLIGALFALENQGQLNGDSVHSIVNNVFSYGYSMATLTCREAFVASQTIDIDCNKPGQGEKVRNNPNCQLCLKRTKEWLEGREKLDKDANVLNPNYTIPTDPKGLQDIIGIDGNVNNNTVGNSGICQYVCEQCVALQLEQNIQFQIANDCEVDTPEFRRVWSGAMTDKAEQNLSQHVKALEQVQQGKKLRDLAITLSNSITTITKTNLLTEVKNQALIYQGIVIRPNSTSVVLQNVKQSVSMKVIANISGSIYTAQQLAILSNSKTTAELAQLKITLNDLYKELADTYRSMQAILQNTLGQIIISIVSILITFVLIFAVLVYLKSNLIAGT